jgi:mannose-6-phosphate isomerase-like protein (cupin superfamily)
MSRKYVYPTTGLKRYRFPTHVNELVVDRSEASCSEVFVVVLAPGEAPPLHKHDDTEQVYYVLEGRGVLSVGQKRETHPVAAGQVVVVPPGTWHSIRAEGGAVRYLAVDCFVSKDGRLEATWDEHVRAVCRQQGWDYSAVVGS